MQMLKWKIEKKKKRVDLKNEAAEKLKRHKLFENIMKLWGIPFLTWGIPILKTVVELYPKCFPYLLHKLFSARS
jgi:hypothetical protein